MEYEFPIDKDDPVRLLCHIIGGLNLKTLRDSYKRIGENSVQPWQMLAILLEARFLNVSGTRSIEDMCKNDIRFLYILRGKKAPDHSTLARFQKEHLGASVIEDIFQTFLKLLKASGAIAEETVFIDGTKIESVASKTQYVWKKNVLRNRQTCLEKAATVFDRCEEKLSISIKHGKNIRLRELKKLRRKLRQKQRSEKIVFVHGAGKRKTELQRIFEQLDETVSKLKRYTWQMHFLGGRNSMAKTDIDATYMRVKEDNRKNGQLKAAYNVQYCVDSEFIVGVDIFQNPADVNTLIPTIERMEERGLHYENVVADAGYDGEENSAYLEAHGQKAFIQPSNYEMRKTKRWKSDIGRRENMTYLPDEDAYLCSQGRKIKAVGTSTRTNKQGTYTAKLTRYACESCKDCPCKTKCIHGNHSNLPMEERDKHFEVSKKFQQYREEQTKRVDSKEGRELMKNRGIQAEGVFSSVKSAMKFRRFLTKGIENVRIEAILYAMAHDILKLHFKIQNGRFGEHLFPIRQAA